MRKKKAKKQAKSTKSITKKRHPVKRTAGKKPAGKKPAKKKAAVRKSSRPKMAAKKVIGRTRVRALNALEQERAERTQEMDRAALEREGLRSRSGGQSGDLQGLSNIEGADSESVDELLEEGNPFEADVVAGVENAGRRSERAVRTQEVPEDDVPEEYLDEQ